MGRQPAKSPPNTRADSPERKMIEPGSSPRGHTRLLLSGCGALILAIGAWALWKVQVTPPNPDEIWRRAQASFRAGRYDEVAADLDRLSQLRAPTPPDWFLRAELAAIKEHLAEALADLENVPDEHPIAAEAHLIAGQIERRRNRVRYAERAFLEAVRLDSSLALAHRELIRIYAIQVRRAEFNREFQVLVGLTTLSFDDVYHWTSVRNNLWEPGDVAEELFRFVEADPEDRWSRLALADVFRRMGRSVQSLRTLSVLPADDAEALAIRAQIALDLEDGKEADKLLEAGPADNPTLARLRGRKALAARDVAAALRNFKIAYAADPDDSETLNGLRVAYWLNGNHAEATSFKETSANLARLNTLLQRGHAERAKENLKLMRDFGIACAALHRDSEARAWLGLAIAGDPLDSEAQKALSRLPPTARVAGQASQKP